MNQKKQSWLTHKLMVWRLLDRFVSAEDLSPEQQEVFLTSLTEKEISTKLASLIVTDFDVESLEVLFAPEKDQVLRRIIQKVMRQFGNSEAEDAIDQLFCTVCYYGTPKQALPLFQTPSRYQCSFVQSELFECALNALEIKPYEEFWIRLSSLLPESLLNDSKFTKILLSFLAKRGFEKAFVELMTAYTSQTSEELRYGKADFCWQKMLNRFELTEKEKELCSQELAYPYIYKGIFKNYWYLTYGTKEEAKHVIETATLSNTNEISALFGREDPELVERFCSLPNSAKTLKSRACDKLLLQPVYRDVLFSYCQKYELSDDALLALLKTKDKELIRSILELDLEWRMKNMDDNNGYPAKIESAISDLHDTEISTLYAAAVHLPYRQERELLLSNDLDKIQRYAENHILNPLNEILFVKNSQCDVMAYVNAHGPLEPVAEIVLCRQGKDELVKEYIDYLFRQEATELSEYAEKAFFENGRTDILMNYIRLAPHHRSTEDYLPLLNRGEVQIVEDLKKQIQIFSQPRIWVKFVQSGNIAAIQNLISFWIKMPEAQHALIGRNEEALSMTFAEQGTFATAQLETKFVENCSSCAVLEKYFSNHILSPEAAEALIRRHDAHLLDVYLSYAPLTGSALSAYEEVL